MKFERGMSSMSFAIDAVGGGPALGVAEDEAVQIRHPALTEAFIGRKEKCLLLTIGPPRFPPNWLRLKGGGSLEVKVKKLRASSASLRRNSNSSPWNWLASGTGRHVDNRSRTLPVFRAESRVVDLELLNRADGGLEQDATEDQVVQRNAVDEVIDGFLAVAGGIDRQCAQTADRCSRKAIGRHNRAWGKHGEIEKVAPIQWYFLGRATVDEVPDAGGADRSERAVMSP